MKQKEFLQMVWSEFQNRTTNFLSDILTNHDFSDVSLACEDGEILPAHRVVICAGSIWFQQVLRGIAEGGGHPQPLIFLKGVKREQLEAILDFLYKGETRIQKHSLDSFLQLGRDLGVRGLAQEDVEDETLSQNLLKNENFGRELIPSYDKEENEATTYFHKDLDILNTNSSEPTLHNLPTWKGEKLYPPSKKVTVKSKAWKFGGFRKKCNGQLDLSNSVCGVCGREIKYSHSPNGFTQHLMRYHGEQYHSNQIEKLVFSPLNEETQTFDVHDAPKNTQISENNMNIEPNHIPTWNEEKLFPPKTTDHRETLEAISEIEDDMMTVVGGKWQCKVCSSFTEDRDVMGSHVKIHV